MYNIQRRTPATDWYTIHRGFDLESAQAFLEEMARGGYDKSGTDGSYNPDVLESRHYDNGDLYEFRAVKA